MGTQFTPNSIPSNIVIMKFLIGLCLVACAVAAPLELTPEVAEATAQHLAAHAAASKGAHASLAPVQGAAFYLADDAAVAAAKVEFQKYFDAAAAGAPLTPVTLPVV